MGWDAAGLPCLGNVVHTHAARLCWRPLFLRLPMPSGSHSLLCLCSRVMLAALKFFLGQDAAEDKGDGGSTIRWLRGSGAALCA